ncbi:TetR/AcrR family transcriptional regulator [Parahaliea mediterranea]|uniref:TetR/AcrR family transcriptional regulator n=1 Tax=Parahaliea mediterranea TaxID=651086 RepID=A0A939IH94_9GAMM|nr:TetR/AcrR family transcriptional regulator [Parahaliea mediterranea]MBN7795104.1 TetR/AcrR family transcriptional regulator [Parahaliea mediterranea]
MNAIAPSLSRRERKKRELRDKIKAETQELIAAKGTEEVTIDAICEAVDISRKTFYNYYGTKDELLFDICVARLVELIEGSIDEAMAAHQGLAARLGHVLNSMRDHLRDSSEVEMEFARYSITSIGHSLSSGGTLLSLMNDYFLRLFREHQPEIRPGLCADFCAEMTVGMVNSVILNAIHQADYDSSTRYNELRDFLLQSMVRGD